MKRTGSLLISAVIIVCLALGGAFSEETQMENTGEPDYLLARAEYPAPISSQEDIEGWFQAYSMRRSIEIPNRDSLTRFLFESARICLQTPGKVNPVFSPVSLAQCLSILAQLTQGSGKAQILSAMGAESAEALSAQMEALWLSLYEQDETSSCVPSASLWLNDGMTISQEALSRMAGECKASVFSGKMGDEAYDRVLRDWLNEAVNGLLSDSVNGMGFSPETAMTLVSTLYLRAPWMEKFYPIAPDVFHAKDGDRETDFMRCDAYENYYTGKGFTAVRWALRNGAKAYFILPDAGVSPEELLEQGEALRFLDRANEWENEENALVHFTLPKIDSTADLPLEACLKELGVRDVFSAADADFSGALEPGKGFSLTLPHQMCRLVMDEDGVVAAAITVFPVAGALLPQKIVDFTLNRPFLYAVETERNIPLFIGIYHTP